ncbi:DUF1499 domain-containing protein [Microvirga roseola]|uniref:DUF1499 domain-containing protein n=1 Tax=Microvirga roseola TaxID=2883126 RepID=UPI001E4FE5A6|nr:DUF1499 domain-containing protein [Microvirga roseola]
MVKKPKAAMAGLTGLGLGYGLWRTWEATLDRVWQSTAGSPDLGPVDFATLRRRHNPNDALACPRDFCPEAKPDFEPPVFPVPPARLRAVLAEVASSEPNTTLVQSGTEQDRYLVRTRFWRFPDTVVAQVIGLDEDRSTLALYSRSQLGRSDLGVNRRRLQRWVERIGRLAAPAEQRRP